MSFNCRDFFEIANYLLQNDTAGSHLDAARYRTVIGRAYYAAFLRARDYMSDFCNVDFDKDRTSLHNRVARYLQTSSDSKIRFAGVKLDSLRRGRSKADYSRDMIVNIKRVAESAISNSRQIIKELEKLRSGEASIDPDKL
ncbi:MAG: hypothetical protein GF315_05780 [candidate division Zixibacteria bacterium]|nr:hypothetical protein [candidate division Zixibacteria bacterium]